MSARGLLRRASDLTAVVDACYAAPAADDAWARDVVGAFEDLLEGESLVGLVGVAHAPDCGSGDVVVSVTPPNTAFGTVQDLWAGGGGEAFRRYFYPPDLVTTHSSIESNDVGDRVKRIGDGYRRSIAAADMLGLIVHPEPNVALVLFASMATSRTVTSEERRRLAQIALHLETGFRMRRRRRLVRAVLGADGRLLDSADGERNPHLEASARAVDAARSARELDPWTALVRGEVSVVPSMRGSRRVYEIVENAPASRPFRALSKREADVLALAARGLSAKLCGYALGISDATVSHALANAAAKVGVAARIELVRIAALLANDPRTDASDVELTDAEHEILELLQQGLSNAAIAARRGRSVRTIANQVSALLRKTRSDSRRALVARAKR